MSHDFQIVSQHANESSKASGARAIVPAPRCPVSIRVAGTGDLPFIDELQSKHTKMVGWFPAKQMEAYVSDGYVLIAEDEKRTRLGYCISRDRYMGRDDVGIIYQLNVMPTQRRHLVGASLVKAVFERAAYGCKLFCCWCAQDIDANHFWEALGFFALAFRAGSRGKQRVHIFWQRRVRENDDSTPFWFPSETRAGAIRENRLVLPIPPGTSWRDAKPIVLPGSEAAEPVRQRALPSPRKTGPKITDPRQLQIIRSESKHLQGLPPGKAAIITGGRIRYVQRADYVPEKESTPAKKALPTKPEKKPAVKNDPKLVAAARELRDRYLEHINTPGNQLPPQGKYDVSRQLGESQQVNLPALKQLPHAA